MIVVDKLEKRWGARTVLAGVSVRFERGKVSSLVGPSGAGKSTLLRCINGLETFDAGRIEVGGVTITPAKTDAATLRAVRQRVGMVFQHFGLFSHMTALANVMEAPIHVRGLAETVARERATALLEKVGLGHRKDAFPRELSGGEQQRVAIARALAMDPEALLLDEPTSSLDPERKAEVVAVLRPLAEEGTTMIVVTHEAAVLREIVHHAIALRDGMIVATGAPDHVLGDVLGKPGVR
jgi:polar amino acid transport system ATP-binding protein